MAEHSPGPWVISTLDRRTIGRFAGHHVLKDATLGFMGSVPLFETIAVVKERGKYTEGNARLIASAPDVAASHARVVAALAEVIRVQDDPPTSTMYNAAWKEARAAVAEARAAAGEG